jgi:hypothetical protein
MRSRTGNQFDHRTTDTKVENMASKMKRDFS